VAELKPARNGDVSQLQGARRVRRMAGLINLLASLPRAAITGHLDLCH